MEYHEAKLRKQNIIRNIEEKTIYESTNTMAEI